MRAFNNWAIVIIMFFIAAVAFAQTPFAIIGDIVAIVISYYVVFYILDTRAIKIQCPHCGKILKTNTPWVCGFCGVKNQNANEFPFVHRCEHCGAEQKAYKCHHGCTEPILLTDDADGSMPAYCAVAPVVDKAPEEAAREAVKRQIEKNILADEIEITKLTAELNERKNRLDLTKKKSIEEDFNSFRDPRLGAKEFAERKKAENAEKYKNNKDILDRENAIVDEWLRSKLFD